MIESAQVQIDEALSSIRRRRDVIDVDPRRLGRAGTRSRAIARNGAQAPGQHRRAGHTAPGHGAAVGGRRNRWRVPGERLEVELAQASAATRPQPANSATIAAQREADWCRGQRPDGNSACVGGSFECAGDGFQRTQVNGADSVEFLVSANPGMPPRPPRKVASGGELARISLALSGRDH